MGDRRRILMIGGSGQLGRELAAMRWPDSFALIAPSRDAVDITDHKAVASILAEGDWAVAINVAAFTAVDAAEEAVAKAFAANALGPAILAEETRRRGVPLIHISTDYVFDGAKPTPYGEDDAPNPLGVYGASKLAGEAAVRTGNPRHVIVRTSWLCGRHGRNFVKTMLRLAEMQDTIRVVDDQCGTPTAAPDLAGTLIRIATSPDIRDRSGTYHFANRGETTWCGLARRIFALSAAGGGPNATVEAITTADYPTPAKRPLNSRLSTARIENDFGIVPRAWEDALADVVGTLLGEPHSAPPG
jgi:dTDP-4-dehydrorhamnose reductase